MSAVVHARIPGSLPGWDKTACGRRIATSYVEFTDDPAAVTCRRCLTSPINMARAGEASTDGESNHERPGQ